MISGARRSSPSGLLRSAFRGAGPWLATYARVGHLTKGIVYLLVGGLALKVALGAGGRVTDGAGALANLHRQPFGKYALVAIGIGLLGYASWRLVQAIVDPERRRRALFLRIGDAASGIGHALLAFGAFKLVALGRRAASGDQQTRLLSHELLGMPHGQAVLWGLGALVTVIGAVIFFRALGATDVCKDLILDRFRPSTCEAIAGILRFGRAVQGVLFCVVGIFLIAAASGHRPGMARGPAGALRYLARMPHGQLILGLIALGLLAVAVSCFIDAYCRRFPR
jgi:hypothetical protein